MHITSFNDFWPSYVRQHAKPRTRTLHATGSVLAVAFFGSAFAVNLWLLAAVPIVGYGFAWYAHAYVERSRPLSFRHPFYSLLADFRMVFLMMAGKMDAEVAKCVLSESGSPDPQVAGRPRPATP